jgi:uncharacterized protein (UPF0147 family)
MATNAALGAVDPSLQKKFDQIISVDNIVGKSNAVPFDSAGVPNGATADTEVNTNLGWVNGFRAWLAGKNVGLTYKQTYIDPIVESVTNNKVVVLSETIVKNAVADAAQSAAETMNLVKMNADGQYEQLLDLDPQELDERIDNLNNLLQDKTVQKNIGEAASTLVEAAQEPLEKAQKELVEISAKMVEDVSEQGALALGNALKVLPVVGNALSAAGAIQNITDVVATAADGAKDALDVTKDLSVGVQLNLQEEMVNKLADDSTNKVAFIAALETYKNTLNDQIQIKTREIDELKKRMESTTDDKNDILIEIQKKESEIKEHKTILDKWSKDPRTQLPTLSNQIPMAAIGGGKSRKRRARAARLTSKRISDCLKQHFSKTQCAPKKSHTKKKRKHMKQVVK